MPHRKQWTTVIESKPVSPKGPRRANRTRTHDRANEHERKVSQSRTPHPITYERPPNMQTSKYKTRNQRRSRPKRSSYQMSHKIRLGAHQTPVGRRGARSKGLNRRAEERTRAMVRIYQSKSLESLLTPEKL